MGKLLKSGENFKGKGKRSNYLTSEDQKNIVDRALQIVNSREHFDSAVLKNLIKQEMEVLRVNFPERSSHVDTLMSNPNRFQSF